MHFINKDTGFVTGKGLLPLATAVILYTIDEGLSWSYKFQNTTASEYCWKIQRLNNNLYFASIEDMTNVSAKILKSVSGSMSWTSYTVSAMPYYIEGIGFINESLGWTGGDIGKSFQSTDGGITWDTINICPRMNRVYRVNNTLLFATGSEIWKYKGTGNVQVLPANRYAWMKSHPNPVNDILAIDITLRLQTQQVMIMLFDNNGRRIKIIENANKPKGTFNYRLTTKGIASGIYYLVLKTHEDKSVAKIFVRH